jgi:hypothetical protein
MPEQDNRVRDAITELLQGGVKLSEIVHECWAYAYIHPSDIIYKEIICSFRILKDALKIIKKDRNITEDLVPPPLPR